MGTATDTRRARVRRGLAEFLTIFLGVSMGFVAEDWRESLNEGHEVTLVLRGLVSDLDQDLPQLDQLIALDSTAWIQGQWLHANWERRRLPSDSLDTAIAAMYRGAPYAPVRSEYESAKNSGQLRNIGDAALRRQIVSVFEWSQPFNQRVEDMGNTFTFALWDNLAPYVTYAKEFRGKWSVLPDASIADSWAQARRDQRLRSSLVHSFSFRRLNTVQLRAHYEKERQLRDALEAAIEGG